MKTFSVLVISGLLMSSIGYAKDVKTYKHATEYQVGVTDQNVQVDTGTDGTIGSTATDAKLSNGGEGIHLLHTDAGTYRVEAPVNKGATILLAMGTPTGSDAPTIHNKWFLDNVEPGTKVLFAARCAKPNTKHPNRAVRCTFWLPDPDSTSHEYETLGDFMPNANGDGSNVEEVGSTLCGTGKLNPATEAQLCGKGSNPTPNPPPPTQ